MTRLRQHLSNLFDRLLEERPTKEEMQKLREETMQMITDEECRVRSIPESAYRFMSGAEERERKANLGW